jgi:hypothetical protein
MLKSSNHIKLLLYPLTHPAPPRWSGWIRVTDADLHTLINSPGERGNWIKVRVYSFDTFGDKYQDHLDGIR